MNARNISLITALVLLLAGFTALQYMMPANFSSQRGLSTPSIKLFAEVLGINLKPIGLNLYTLLFRSVIIAAVLVHGILAKLCSQNTAPKRHVLVALIICANLAMAVFFPASLSSDIYNYAATAHLFAYDHLNPYTHSPLELYSMHDPVVRYIGQGFSSLYGPIWTYSSGLLMLCLRGSSLFAQVVAYKILESLAILAISVIAAKYCDRIKTAYGTAAMVAVGLNPLFMVEGSGNGHNDFVMMAFFLLALLYWGKSLWKFGLLMGLAVSIKLMPLALIPWLVIHPSPRHQKTSVYSRILLVALILAPSALLMPPFWAGGSAINAFFTRINLGNSLLHQKASLPNSQQIVTTRSTSNPVKALASQSGIVTYYIALTLLLLFKSRLALRKGLMIIVRQRIGLLRIPAWLLCWIALVTLAEFFGRGYWYSWYYSWALVPAALCWNRRGNVVLAFSMAVALADSMNYSIP